MSKYTYEKLCNAVKQSKSWANVCRIFNTRPASGSQSHIKKLCDKYKIDSSHFTGQGWRKGKLDLVKKDAMEYCYNGSNITSNRLKLNLIRDGYKKAECEECGLSEWRGQPIVLELDHKNSDHFDNTFDNLQILCPNCHSMFTRDRRKSRRKSTKRSWDHPSLIKEKIVKEKKKRIYRIGARKRKVEWPNKEELIKLRLIMNWCAIGRKYGVSDNAVRKWAKHYGLM